MAEIERLDLAGAYKLQKEDKLQGLFIMDEPDYRGSPGMNQSILKSLKKSPATYKQALRWDSIETKKSKALELGQLIHLLILEGQEAFEKQVSPSPDADPRTKVYKEAKKEIEESGKVCVSKSDLELIRGIWESMVNDPIASKLLTGGIAEVACFGKHPVTGILQKGKVDYAKEHMLIDLKTTISASESDFSKSARKFQYDIQAAFYLDLMNRAVGYLKYTHFIILAVEKSPPYLFNYFVISPEDIQAAREEIESLMNLYLKCEAHQNWPGYSRDFKVVNFAGWK